jgi:hypothetical protein
MTEPTGVVAGLLFERGKPYWRRTDHSVEP